TCVRDAPATLSMNRQVVGRVSRLRLGRLAPQSLARDAPAQTSRDGCPTTVQPWFTGLMRAKNGAEALSKPVVVSMYSQDNRWCAREDLNLHPLRDQILSLACLPFHHARNPAEDAPLSAQPQGWFSQPARVHRTATGAPRY